MLVLSRKANQQFVFPNLGIKINVIQVKGKLVKIGIDAPAEFTVVREESLEQGQHDQDLHRLRNELNLLQLKIEAIQRRLGKGVELQADQVLEQIFDSAQDLESHLVDSPQWPTDSQAFRLLIVEDSDNERQLMAYVLASHGFQVYVARDGQEALSQLKTWNWRPHLVMMDMQMPLFDGLSTLSEIRSDPQLADIPVVAVTGSPHIPEYELPCRSWDAWFAKPLDIQQLLDYIHQLPKCVG